MIKREFVVANEAGLHARAASKFVQLTNSFLSNIEVEYNENSIDGKSIMCIISMGIPSNGKIIVTIKGPDEEEAMEKMETFLQNEILDV